MDKKKRFIELCNATQRQGMDNLLAWLESSDFYTAPASSSPKRHGAYPGGLLEHSLNVYDELVKLNTLYPDDKIKPENLVITALLHDLCKVNFYKPEKRNRKNAQGAWEQYDAYTIDEKFCYGGHGSKSVFLASKFIELTLDEAVAINCHMGSWEGNNNVGNAYEKCTLAWLVHVADEAATFVVESKDKER